jgi:hypothetical protein
MTILLLLALVLIATAFVLHSPFAAGSAKRKAVVVELFTSEGCSSCPPADALLSRLSGQKSANGAEIIPLGFHVDYWDHQGWRDRFSSHDFTERQQKYSEHFNLDGPYTPQMVVDGESEFVGSSSGQAQEKIAEAAAEQQQAEIQLSAAPAQHVMVRVHAEGVATGEVMMAITEDNLSNKVGGGENGGRELHHVAVVRQFRSLGQLKNGEFQEQEALQIAKDWKAQDLRCVVFVQMPRNGSILGAASLPVQSAAGN